MRRSLKNSDLLLSLAEIGFKAFFRVENCLSYTYVFGCDFQQLVVVDKLYCLFKTQNTRSFESERVVAARSARVCEMLFLAYVYAYVLAFGRNPHHHALVNFRSGHNEQRAALLRALGVPAEEMADSLTVRGVPSFSGGTVDGANDHRIVMAAAAAATAAAAPVTVTGAEAVRKSYPSFWEEYKRLGGSFDVL